MSISAVDFEQEKHQVLEVIRQSFLTVAQEFGFTPQNAPTNPAFLPLEKLEESVQNGLDLFVAREDGRLVGCVGIQPGRGEGEFYLERLAVLAECRHAGIGSALVKHALEQARNRQARRISMGIVNENTRLKDWYLSQGFSDLGCKKFDHLPFTVCFMGMELETGAL